MGLDGSATIQPAAHIAYLYRDDDERRYVVAEFVRAGLNQGQYFVYCADAPTARIDSILAALGVLPIDRAHRHQFVTVSADEVYLTGPAFEPDHPLSLYRGFYQEGRRDGLTGTRLAGEMGWALRGKPGSDRLMEYEERVNAELARFPMIVLCQYDMRVFDGAIGFEALRVHPMLLVGGRVIPNPYIDDRSAVSARRRA